MIKFFQLLFLLLLMYLLYRLQVLKQLRIFPFVVNFRNLTHLLINFKIGVNFEYLFVRFIDPFF